MRIPRPLRFPCTGSASTLVGGLRAACLFFLGLTLAQCSAGYEQVSAVGGYAVKEVGPYTLEVSFEGNRYTPRKKIESLLLLRCAEVALKRGYPKFVLMRTAAGSSSFVDASDSREAVTWDRDNYTATTTLQLLCDDPQWDVEVFDARSTWRQLMVKHTEFKPKNPHFHNRCTLWDADKSAEDPSNRQEPTRPDAPGRIEIVVDQKVLAECRETCTRNRSFCESTCRTNSSAATAAGTLLTCLNGCESTQARCDEFCQEKARQPPAFQPPKKTSTDVEKPVMVVPFDQSGEDDSGEKGASDESGNQPKSLSRMDQNKTLVGTVRNNGDGQILYVKTAWGVLYYQAQTRCYRFKAGDSVRFNTNPVDCHNILIQNTETPNACWFYCQD